MKNQHEIIGMFGNDFSKAFDFVRREMRDECIKVIQTEADVIFGPGIHHDTYPSMRQRMVDKIRKLGPAE